MPLDDNQRRVIAAIDGPPRDEEGRPQRTPEGQAQASGAPQSEAAQMGETPYFELDLPNGQKRSMSREQIVGMASRYSDLNYKHSQLKPVISVIDKYMAANPNMTPAQLAQQLDQLAAGGQGQGVQFGRGGVNDPDGDGRSTASNNRRVTPSSDDFSKWETENASSLPPGYRDMHENFNSMAASQKQMMAMMQQVLGSASGQVDAARQAQMGARQATGQSVQATIGNNLDRSQQTLGIPTQSAQDFMMFAQQRGYNMEDFVDPELTHMVMTDFKNNMQSPEMDRMRQIHQRRTAYTPGGGQAPMGAGSQPSPEAAEFAGFADRVIKKQSM